MSPASARHPEIRLSPLPPFLMLVRVSSRSAVYMRNGVPRACAGPAVVVAPEELMEAQGYPRT